MPLDPELIAAYENAVYAVFDGPELHIGKPNAAMDRLLEARGAATAAFVTAANPRGVQRSSAANEAAMAALRDTLRWPHLPGEGLDPQNRWPAEPSVLVLGISRPEAEALGRHLEQNAIVFVERGGAPHLVLLAKMRLVVDTQVWLDWLVFDDPSVAGLREAIASGRAEALIDEPCLAELERVLAYPLNRMVDRESCLQRCLKLTHRVTAARVEHLPRCRDPDDQKFVELAAGAGADCLVTRDRELLRLRKRCEARFRILPPQAFRRR
jgi:uncharacterized protein